jgi:uncharacterized protein YecE (DUF72 family)
MKRRDILIGTSGFSYDDWRGRWYPPEVPRGLLLETYASVFDALEINATYYGTPAPGTAASMVRRAAGRLRFTIKAPGDVTHRHRLDDDVLVPFRRFLEPFEEAGVLDVVLLQFPNAFRNGPAGWEFLGRLRERLGNQPLALEFRHDSWDTDAVDARLGEFAWVRVAVDQPRLRGLSSAERPPVARAPAYFRFHGRNADAWYAGEEASARYRYEYSSPELEGLARRVRAAAAVAQTTFVFFNNHPEGAAPRNAEELAALLEVPLRGSGHRDLFSP